MAAIFFASSLPTVPAIVGDTSDLLLHFVAFAGLGLLVIRAIAAGQWHRLTAGSFVRGWLITAGYGATDELHQAFVPGRFASVLDWIADAAGAAAALVIVAAIRALARRRPGSREV
jgi:VanZ family protein